MPGVMPIVGDTEEEAKAKYKHMQQDVDPIAGLAYLRTRFSGDISLQTIDKPAMEVELHPIGIQSRGELMLKRAAQENWTLRELYQNVMVGNAHGLVVGTPKQVADYMEEWFEAGAADGFNLVPYKSPAALEDFVGKVVPELQRRGLFRTSYEAETLRGNLGLPPL